MIKGLSGATVWSEDLNNLLPFYRDTLGLRVSLETPAFVVLGDGNGPNLALGTHSEVKGRASDPYRPWSVWTATTWTQTICGSRQRE